MQKPDTIVLIHGLFMTALSWEKWVERYTNRGFRVIARSWKKVLLQLSTHFERSKLVELELSAHDCGATPLDHRIRGNRAVSAPK